MAVRGSSARKLTLTGPTALSARCRAPRAGHQKCANSFGLQGKPIKLICRELNLGEGTIKGHVSAVLRALNVMTRTQAIVAAHRLGLVFEPAPSGTAGKPTSKLR